MKFGLSGLLFPESTVEEVITNIGELGADHVELIFDLPNFPPNTSLRVLPSLKKLIDSYGLGASIHGPIWDLNPLSWHSTIRRLALKYMRKSIDVCSALGGEIVVVHPGRCPFPRVKNFLSPARERFLRFTQESLEYARSRGVKLALENFPMAAEFPYSSPQEMLPLVKELDGLGITFDVGHAFLNKIWQNISSPERRIAEEIKLVGDHIVNVHFHDNRGRHDDHLPPGEGSINFRPIVNALRKIGYDGWITVELHHLAGRDPTEIGETGLKRTKDLFRF
ncbi:MAG: sugar phosphate isomerase/epimerase family protein [Candidatus Hadarchaeum sp.]|uniref:sugar phosphate isomerase/epimerase family protein n=1 Tax=Candidatus Hadarchaeum sp. TaxID=2883567 RepID=UPI003D144852